MIDSGYMRRLASLITVALLVATVAPLWACAGSSADASAMACCRRSRGCAGTMAASGAVAGVATATACCAAREMPAPQALAPEAVRANHLPVAAAARMTMPLPAGAATALAAAATISPPAAGPPLAAPLRI